MLYTKIIKSSNDTATWPKAKHDHHIMDVKGMDIRKIKMYLLCKILGH